MNCGFRIADCEMGPNYWPQCQRAKRRSAPYDIEPLALAGVYAEPVPRKTTKTPAAAARRASIHCTLAKWGE
jgi:hypothetical protein